MLKLRVVLLAIPVAVIFLFVVYIYVLTGAGVVFEDFAIVLGGLIVIIFISWLGVHWVRKATRQGLESRP